ncbi:class I SAM-dependent methyltransferase [Epibacterium sp. Ofav1-8]|uniref:class I SAM-dependent methyltransferase n=1 Tax=Epibacterium sp. Ofav1-8 TaxID=2917735 RepID=UPI001EF442CB|nr:class I SAM-dependent methyltransferase [Epibacterium sp. Ofav1-8]MCG7625076.1 class I SAM-dependent methyltransferase [Epibacterium sp. Ofav1-8]
MKPTLLDTDTPESFWDRHWSAMTQPSSGTPSAALERLVSGRSLGRAVDLGCGRGDDAVWLARNGWQVVAVDVSQTALDTVRHNAEAAGVAQKVTCVRHDLSRTWPEGSFDLVLSMFTHTPMEFDRAAMLRSAATLVAPGGLLLIAGHGSLAPWAWSDPEIQLPNAQDVADALDLLEWTIVEIADYPREARGSQGQVAQVLDSVTALERPLK